MASLHHFHDGFLRLPHCDLQVLRLTHSCSGLDEEAHRPAENSAEKTNISGYTEWAALTGFPVSIGWDWTLEVINNSVRCVRHGLPRSNLMLTDARGVDLGMVTTETALAQLIDASADKAALAWLARWKTEVFVALSFRQPFPT
jgi:Domain of unknown function (DUF4902)